MKLTEKVLLSEHKEKIVLNDGADDPSKMYEIFIPDTDYLVIEVGAMVGKAVAKYEHHNISASFKRIYEFKHHRHGGGKFWTRAAGISHYLIIPTNKIHILPEEGYSYIQAEINGVKVSFNVSGGGGSNGWADYLHSFTQVSVNHKLADFHKLCGVAIRNSEIEDKLNSNFKQLDEHDLERWNNMSDKKSPKVKKGKEALLKRIHDKDSGITNSGITIVIKEGFTEKQGIAVSVNRCGKKEMLTETSWQYDMSKGRCKSVIVNFHSGYPKRVKDSQIDWVKTVQENAELLYEHHAIVVDKSVEVY